MAKEDLILDLLKAGKDRKEICNILSLSNDQLKYTIQKFKLNEIYKKFVLDSVKELYLNGFNRNEISNTLNLSVRKVKEIIYVNNLYDLKKKEILDKWIIKSENFLPMVYPNGISKYYINDYGQIWDDENEFPMFGGINKHGYHQTSLLEKTGKINTHKTHRLVGYNFVDDGKFKCRTKGFLAHVKDLTINHKFGNKTDNFYKNIEWMSSADNVSHAHSTGLCKQLGEDNHQSVLTEKQVKEIILLINTGYRNYQISKVFNCKPSIISDIRNNRKWKHISREIK